MPIPDYQTVMLPLLRFAGDQQEHSLREAIDRVSDKFNLTKQERQALLPNGQQPIFHNRVAWAQTFMKKAGLLTSTRRWHFRITHRGLEVLKQNPNKIDVKFLDQFKEFREFRDLKRERLTDQTVVARKRAKTPEQLLKSAYQTVRNELAKQLLQRIKESPLSLFERVVVKLLHAMGYGGGRRDAIKGVGRTDSDGFGLIIKGDPLGLDTIYIQAERLESVVSRAEIRQFIGALQRQRAKEGIFIATSSFSPEAHEYSVRIDRQIVLIHGDLLAQYMIDYNIGVSPLATYEIKKVDLDYLARE
jgi:restriction system protein